MNRPALLPALARLNRPPRRCRLPLLAWAALACLGAAPALASHVGEELETDQLAVQSGDRLLDSLRQFESLPPAARAAREPQLALLAQARRDRLLRLMERNPQLAAARLLPPGLRERFPASAQAFLEQELAPTSGRVYATVADDFDRGVARKEFRFQPAGGGASLRLHLADAGGGERDLLGWTGRGVTLKGTRLGGRLLLRQVADVEPMAAEGTATTTTTSGNNTPTVTPVVTGQRRTLAILANFSDSSLTCSATDVANRVFGSSGSTVNTIYRESSRDVVSFHGEAVGPFTIPYSASGSCEYGGWASALDTAARNAGIDLSKYNHLSYVVPRNSNCRWSGLAYMPGTRSWIASCGSTGLYAHELGHNLSLHHAATPTSEYGDSSDSMGSARTVRANGANQVMAGWVPTGGLLDVSVGGSYAVGALQPESNGSPQVLRLVKPDTQEFYYVSLRQKTGVDAALASTFVDTVSIHRATGRLPAKTILLQTLGAGAGFTDSVNGIQIVNQGVGGGVATVSVAFSGSSCARHPPAVALDPGSASTSTGGSVSYRATVSNRNTAACGTDTIALAQVLPGGITGSLSASSLALAGGTSSSITWQVQAGTAAADGTYTLDLSASEPAAGSTTAHASLMLTTDSTPPALAITSPAPGAVLSGNSTTLAASASDASGVSAVEFYVGSTLLARDTKAPWSASWNLRKAAKTSHTITVKAFDRAGNVATQQVSVTVK